LREWYIIVLLVGTPKKENFKFRIEKIKTNKKVVQKVGMSARCGI